MAKMVSEDENVKNSIGRRSIESNRNESSGLYCIKFHIPKKNCFDGIKYMMCEKVEQMGEKYLGRKK